eukprot:430750-Rhodomonas_salina.3
MDRALHDFEGDVVYPGRDCLYNKHPCSKRARAPTASLTPTFAMGERRLPPEPDLVLPALNHFGRVGEFLLLSSSWCNMWLGGLVLSSAASSAVHAAMSSSVGRAHCGSGPVWCEHARGGHVYIEILCTDSVICIRVEGMVVVMGT